jgi:hypothetical protein
MDLGSAHWKQRHPKRLHESFAEDCHRKVADSDQKSERSMNDEKEGWVPIDVPNNLEEMFAAMTSYADEKVA